MKTLTVLLQVKNVEQYINDCLESILNQTFSQFQLLIIDDNSTDSTLEIIKRYKDERIIILHGKKGYIENLNEGIQFANSKYIARMDGDDIMHPSRLEKQLNVMETYQADICSTWITLFGDANYVDGKLSGLIKSPLHQLSIGNFVAHPTVMLNKDFLVSHNLSYEHYFPTEDYKLWFEIAKNKGRFCVIPEPLLNYRISHTQLSRANSEEMNKQADRIRSEIYAYLQTEK